MAKILANIQRNRKRPFFILGIEAPLKAALNSPMAKLYFRYGTVGSAKTLNLLAVAHNYQQQKKKVLILKPEMDTRWGQGNVRSRAGLEKKADILLNESSRLEAAELEGVACVLVDEAQFLAPSVIDHLESIARDRDVPVICYGLRTDFRTELFAGSKRLMELAASIEEVKNTCHYCNKKAVFNLKFVNGAATREGPAIQLGAEETYLPACPVCYEKAIRSGAPRSG